MKITNICDSEHLTDCGLPDKIIPLNGGSSINLSSINSLAKYNSYFDGLITNNVDDMTYEQLDTKAGAFETVNGESILVYYNPNCESDLKENSKYYTQPKMCANFVYDLNGKKGPNTVGKDIGFISALYATDPVVVSPNNYSITSERTTYPNAILECKKKGEDYKLLNIDDITSIFYNMKLINIEAGGIWSSTKASETEYYAIGFTSGRRIAEPTTNSRLTFCAKK